MSIRTEAPFAEVDKMMLVPLEDQLALLVLLRGYFAGSITALKRPKGRLTK